MVAKRGVTGESGFASEREPENGSTTSKEGSRRANYPLPERERTTKVMIKEEQDGAFVIATIGGEKFLDRSQDEYSKAICQECFH
ncbi:hypothetical protein JTE90_013630 [Oedothorax gibbosus]|uniref:Uncharacterized protein n=1 Tax=Oedothorax gibbosus TaxID=931172 RepID=A0AAV6TI54_9ARAC|nr:hypothetical protein JTE90_013630 [Oedothorax gibbosus]